MTDTEKTPREIDIIDGRRLADGSSEKRPEGSKRASIEEARRKWAAEHARMADPDYE